MRECDRFVRGEKTCGRTQQGSAGQIRRFYEDTKDWTGVCWQGWHVTGLGRGHWGRYRYGTNLCRAMARGRHGGDGRGGKVSNGARWVKTSQT